MFVQERKCAFSVNAMPALEKLNLRAIFDAELGIQPAYRKDV
jgi:hypothetical protein